MIAIDDTDLSLNTFIVQASIMIVTYGHHNIYIIQATGALFTL
jgi:hypothetical protein